jgi:hypothetical protein
MGVRFVDQLVVVVNELKLCELGGFICPENNVPAVVLFYIGSVFFKMMLYNNDR